MKRMKRFYQVSTLLFLMFTVSCTPKDVPPKHDKQNVECTKKGTIVTVVMDCVGDYSELGIMDDDNNYYIIEKDKTNNFCKYNEGDKICFDYELGTKKNNSSENQGLNFVPPTFINLTCISECKCKNDCKSVQEVTELPSDTIPTQILNILEMSQQGNILNLKLAFSGCDPDIDPEVLISDHHPITTGTNKIYRCVVSEERVQLCYAYFVRDFCFDLSSLKGNHAKYELVFQTPEGLKSISIVH